MYTCTCTLGSSYKKSWIPNLHGFYQPYQLSNHSSFFSTAVKATMRDIMHDSISQEAYIDLSISHVFRQQDHIFTPASHSRYSGVVVKPLRCGVQWGEGHFLMMGSLVLGQAHLGCSPRYSQARKIAKDLTEKGLNECDLDEIIQLQHHDNGPPKH